LAKLQKEKHLRARSKSKKMDEKIEESDWLTMSLAKVKIWEKLAGALA
jgi:hypothetical protein